VNTSSPAQPLDEQVLVIPTTVFHAAGLFQGFSPKAEYFTSQLFRPEHFQFLPRSLAENDPAFKQLIPYVVLRYGPDIFAYRRGKAGNEKRLHELRSVGVGGHIAREDIASGEFSYRQAMLRELNEEIELGCGYRERCLGLINDDSTPVGQVHLGIVHLFDLEGRDLAPRENALREGRLTSLAELKAAREEFETWSQFVLDLLN
jgi:predicted NUDIX family phosphoesterase